VASARMEEELVVVRAWSAEGAARCIQRQHRRSVKMAGDPTASAQAQAHAPPSPSSRRPMFIGAALLVLLAVNSALNQSLDESGLPVLIVSGKPLSPAATATERVRFRTSLSRAAATAAKDATHGAIRVEVLEQRPPSADADAHTDADADAASGKSFTIVQVCARGHESAELVPEIAARLEMGAVERLVTVFPERAKWRLPAAAVAKGELPPLGASTLLSQHIAFTVKPEHADAFAREWPVFGYSSLNEPGVVRCDLLRRASAPNAFLARKVFRNRSARISHEASAHFAEWRQRVSHMLQTDERDEDSLNTVFPPSTIVPFRTQWAS